MQKFSLCWLALVASLFSVHVSAAEIQIDAASVRATAPGQVTAMGDLSITSKEIALLVGVTTPVAQSVELHVMSHENGMMKMREVKEVPLPAGRTIKLGEEGYHLMLMGLKDSIKEGATVPLTLSFKLSNKKIIKVETSATVKPLIEIKPDAPMNEHEHMHHKM